MKYILILAILLLAIGCTDFEDQDTSFTCTTTIVVITPEYTTIDRKTEIYLDVTPTRLQEIIETNTFRETFTNGSSIKTIESTMRCYN